MHLLEPPDHDSKVVPVSGTHHTAARLRRPRFPGQEKLFQTFSRLYQFMVVFRVKYLRDDLISCVSTGFQLFQCRDLAKEASADNLKDLIYHLITVILDGRLNDEEEGPQVVRTVNVMVVKIVERSDQSKIMR